LNLLIPTIVLIHLIAAPYTKVEESFNLQATHDILTYSTPTSDIVRRLRATYDHFEFPGAVPRSFVGAFLLAQISRPLLAVAGYLNPQLVVRGLLGLYNAFCLLYFRQGLDKAFGREVGRWYILLQAAQFHVIFYASRTLPNSFAFGLTTLAFRQFLPMPATSVRYSAQQSRIRVGIYLLTVAGVIFRAEIAVLLGMQVLDLLATGATSLRTVVLTGLVSAAIALGVSVPLDSYFWQRLLWPELSSFIFNVVHGSSSEWGTSPWHTYFSTFLPKLLLNPLSLPLIAFALALPATRRRAMKLILPSIAFIAIYSLQPHKEARFIIYTIPPFTGAAALAASYVWTRRSRTLYFGVGALLLIASLLLSAIVSASLLAISALNYPGGEALWRLHRHVAENNIKGDIRVHMDVLSCMTGVSRFVQDAPAPPVWDALSSRLPQEDLIGWHYDKTEDQEQLLRPEFWSQFDYVLTEDPTKCIGKWAVIEKIYGYGGVELLRPGDEGPRMTIREAVSEIRAHWTEARRKRASTKTVDASPGANGLYPSVKQAVRSTVTMGWWVGPKIEEKLYILTRQDPLE
jgi:alpha-1,6-mannosyltransferase